MRERIASNAMASPGAARLRAMYEAAARTLLRNAPLRAHGSVSLDPGQALTGGELAALRAVGLTTRPWPREGTEVPEDPLAQSVVDFMALIETGLSTDDAARLLRVDVSRVRQRLRERTLFGVEYEGEWRLPRFQFERKHVLPGLGEVLGAIDADANPLEVAEWFLTPNLDLERKGDESPISPRDWLLRGGAPRPVAELAREL